MFTVYSLLLYLSFISCGHGGDKSDVPLPKEMKILDKQITDSERTSQAIAKGLEELQREIMDLEDLEKKFNESKGTGTGSQ